MHGDPVYTTKDQMSHEPNAFFYINKSSYDYKQGRVVVLESRDSPKSPRSFLRLTREIYRLDSYMTSEKLYNSAPADFLKVVYGQ